jgi:cell division protein FtsB
MDPRTRDERSKVGTDGKAVVSNRRSPAVTAVLLFLALGLVVDGIAGDRGWLANRRSHERLVRAEQALYEARLENARLCDLARRLKTKDPATIEEIARRERGFIKPGEKLFIIRDVPKEK